VREVRGNGGGNKAASAIPLAVNLIRILFVDLCLAGIPLMGKNPYPASNVCDKQ